MQQAFVKKSVFFLLVFIGIFIVQHTLTATNIHAAEKKSEEVQNTAASKEAEPKLNHTKEEVYKPSRGWFDRNKWWVALGTIVLGGSTAALIGQDNKGDNGSDEGVYHLKW